MTWSKRHVIDPTLSLEKIPERGPRNKKYGNTSREPWTFIPERNKAGSLLINDVICEKPPWTIKSCMSSKQKKLTNSQMYSWENYHAIRDFMTKELWKLSNLSSQKLGEFLSKK